MDEERECKYWRNNNNNNVVQSNVMMRFRKILKSGLIAKWSEIVITNHLMWSAGDK